MVSTLWGVDGVHNTVDFVKNGVHTATVRMMPTIPWISLKMVSTLQMVFVHNTVDFVKNGVHTADGVHNTVDGVNKWDKGRKQQRLPGSS